MYCSPVQAPVLPSPRAPSPTRPLDVVTLAHVEKLLTERLDAVVVYGAGGCPTCHDGELRGAIRLVRELREAGK
jgi:hypothetical protein